MVKTKEKHPPAGGEEIKNEISVLNIEEMEKAGLHLGHRTSRINPKMQPYLQGVKNTIHTIDLEKTKEKFEGALGFIGSIIAENKVLLFVGTKIQAKNLIKDTAEECGLPYVNERWLGGTFTNLGVISKRIEHYKELEKKKAEGELEKYTKKEIAQFEEELKRLRIKFGGIKNLAKLPDAIFVADMRKDDLAVKEARMKNIPVIGICDTNVDPNLADYPIPANDDAMSSIKYILEKVKEAVLAAQTKAKIKNAETENSI